jgi:ABC-2 type transport system ATP-binding protein
LSAIETEHLTKTYAGVKAVDDISFTVREGEVFGLLGPNGAGKTTTIRIITTMTKSTSGFARVMGLDVSKHASEVRQIIGYVPQAVSVDGDLTAAENLLIFSKLFYVGKKERKDRIKFALEYMGLSDRANDLVKHFSGGMMRRLEIAQSLVNRPRIMILDEPSIGLDPGSKRQMWKYIKELNSQFNTTVLITTHDMLEANELCDRVAIMHSGEISVIGNPDELKKSVGGEIITVSLQGPATKPVDASGDFVLPSIPVELGAVVSREGNSIKIVTENGDRKIPRLTDFFEHEGFSVDAISLSKPTLDDVFMKYGKNLEEADSRAMYQEARTTRRAIARHSQ